MSAPIWRFPLLRGLLWGGGGLVLLVVALATWRLVTEPPEARARREAHQLEDDCAKGEGPSCSELGVALAAGRGVGRDDARAIAMYKKACDLGSAHGCMNLGNRYREGRGVTRNLALATSYLEEGCTLDSGNACDYLAMIVEERGGPNADAEARRLYERACTLGDGWGCRSARQLGSTVANPGAEEKTFQQAKDGCAAGYPANCYNLGLAYKYGVGVARNPEEGERLIRGACDQGWEPACKALGGKK